MTDERSTIIEDGSSGYYHAGTLPGKRGPVIQWCEARADAWPYPLSLAREIVRDLRADDDMGVYSRLRILFV